MTRKEAIEELEQRLSTLKFLGGNYVDCVNGEAIKVALEALKEQRPTGHWLKPTALSEPICSVCLSAPKLLFGKTSAWCPNCGAKMEKQDG